MARAGTITTAGGSNVAVPFREPYIIRILPRLCAKKIAKGQHSKSTLKSAADATNRDIEFPHNMHAATTI